MVKRRLFSKTFISRKRLIQQLSIDGARAIEHGDMELFAYIASLSGLVDGQKDFEREVSIQLGLRNLNFEVV